MNHNKIIKLLFLSISLVISSCSTSISSNSSFSSYSSVDSISLNETNSSFSTSLSPNSAISSNGDTSSYSSLISPSSSPSSSNLNADSIPSSSIVSSSKEESSVPIHEHVFSDWFAINEPTCTESGLEKRTCSCGYEETRLIDPLNHNYSNEWTIDIEATCNKEGSKSHHCLRCDNKTDITIIPKLDHVPGTPIKENNVDSTCSKKGSYDLVTYCVNCGEKLNIEHFDVDAIAHQLNEPTFIWNEYESCEATSICSVCQETITLSASISSVVINAPSCTDEGLEEYTASISINNQTYSDKKEKILEPLGHNYSDWDVIKEANDYQDGLRKKECSRCHDVVEEIVPTTSPFTFSLNKDGESYTVTGYSALYEGGIIELPETFNGLPINNINLSFSSKLNYVPNILIPNQTITISYIYYNYPELVEKALEMGVKSQVTSILVPDINLLFAGTLTEWFEHITIKDSNAIKPKAFLFLYNKQTSEYEKIDKLVIPEGIKNIKSYALFGINVKEIVCPSSLETIEKFAINSNDLEKVTLNSGVRLKQYCIDSPLLKTLTIPSGVYCEKYGLAIDSLVDVTIEAGASNFTNNSFSWVRLMRVIDNSGSGFSEWSDSVLITKENDSDSALFTYQGFDFALVSNQLYLISSSKPFHGKKLELPENVVYQNHEYTEYTIWSRAFVSSAPMGGINWPSNDDFLTFYSGFENFININNAYTLRDIYQELSIPKSVKGVLVDGMRTSSFVSNYFLKDVYFDGTQEEFYAVFDNQFKTNNFKTVNATIHVKDENGNELTFKIE